MSLLATRIVAKPWGRTDLPAIFAASCDEPIGEVWFEPPPALDALLVKYIFTSDKLSVQCHPSDAQALANGHGPRGKEECWLVLGAEPGASLGIGFRETLDGEAIRAAAMDGSIEELLAWHPVEAGDFLYIPAGTVHAVGAGLTLIEIQQNSDLTYRLYDYGRPRPLHLEEARNVALGEPYPAHLRQRLPESGEAMLVDGPHFRLARLDGPASQALAGRFAGPLLVVPLEGRVTIAGEAATPGQCALAPGIDALDIPASARCLITQPA